MVADTSVSLWADSASEAKEGEERMRSYSGEVAGSVTVCLCFLYPTRDKENGKVTRNNVMGSLNP